jgi:hypothetical protein
MPVFGLRSWRVTGSFVLAALLLVSTARAQDSIPEEAKLYFKNGVELIQSQPPNYQDAYYQFKLAWEKSKSWKVLSNWGLCALKLERDGEAIWAYTEYLRQAGKDVDPEERKELERDLLLLNGNAASVTVSSDVADLEIVDARAGSSVPPQTYRLENGQLALRLRAGSHSLTASSQGKSLRWDVTLSPGRTEEHRFEFSAPAAAAPTSAAAAPTSGVSAQPATGTPAPTSQRDAVPAPKRGGAIRTLGFVVTGAGVLAVGGGVLMGSKAKSQESESRDKCADRPVTGFTCPESTREDFEVAQQNARLANVLLIAGGVVTAGGLAMVIFGGPKSVEKPPSARLELTPAFGYGQAALFAHGSF